MKLIFDLILVMSPLLTVLAIMSRGQKEEIHGVPPYPKEGD